MRKLQTILLVLGIGFFIYLLARIGVRELGRELAGLGWGLVPLVLAEGMAEMIHTVGWRYCLTGPLRTISWLSLFHIRIAGYAINYLTPTAALGGEVTKTVLLASRHRGPEAATGVVVDKVCLALAHLLVVAIGAPLVLWQARMPRPIWAAMLAGGLLLAVGIGTFLWLQQHGLLGGLIRRLAVRFPRSAPLQSAARQFTVLDEALQRFHREHPKDLFRSIAWHVAGFAVGILQTWFFLRLLHPDAALLGATTAWFIGLWFDLLTFAVPLNAGALEGTRIAALQAVGYTAVAGLTFGFVNRLAQMLCAGYGLAAYAWLISRNGSRGLPDPRELPETPGGPNTMPAALNRNARSPL